jgi:hypothetical protein
MTGQDARRFRLAHNLALLQEVQRRKPDIFAATYEPVVPSSSLELGPCARKWVGETFPHRVLPRARGCTVRARTASVCEKPVEQVPVRVVATEPSPEEPC